MYADQYPITFPYGATDAPYSPARPHKGNDRPTPMGTKIRIGSTVIGLTGNSGLSTGPHLHSQAGTDEWCQNTLQPDQYEFKPGKVVHVGNASQWGNYIIMQVNPDRYICYAHLSEIMVKEGQEITGDTMLTKRMQDYLYVALLGRTPTKEARVFVGKHSFEDEEKRIKSTDEYKKEVAKVKAADNILNSHRTKDFRV